MHAGAAIADIGAVDEGRATRFAGDAHRARCGLRDRLEAFEPAIGPLGAKALDRGEDRARGQLLPRVPAEPQPVHYARPEVLGNHIGLLDQPTGDLLAILTLQVDDGATLVAVEQQKEKAVEIRVVAVPQSARTVAALRVLDLDDVRSEERRVGKECRS